jgi:hypothetical protein
VEGLLPQELHADLWLLKVKKGKEGKNETPEEASSLPSLFLFVPLRLNLSISFCPQESPFFIWRHASFPFVVRTTDFLTPVALLLVVCFLQFFSFFLLPFYFMSPDA